ncbi:unnamed protein product [Prorocentrum cordatum]|uniref:Uncharacterized protein n=1 Tax=Prorocentrum cordatum TaxID=2364126 RepID=A0ABN9TK59_9DINO|nr:unnamed protein product [Polarella glacialis]
MTDHQPSARSSRTTGKLAGLGPNSVFRFRFVFVFFRSVFVPPSPRNDIKKKRSTELSRHRVARALEAGMNIRLWHKKSAPALRAFVWMSLPVPSLRSVAWQSCCSTSPSSRPRRALIEQLGSGDAHPMTARFLTAKPVQSSSARGKRTLFS